MRECTLFELPVYRLDRETYYQQLAKFKEDTIFGGRDAEFKREHYRKNPGHLVQFEEHLTNVFGGCWEYNEIIGFISLHILGSQIRGTYFKTKAKRLVRTRKKQFVYSTHKLAPELELPRNGSNIEVFNTIQRYVERCREELPRRFIDDRQLEIIGPYVDWNSLIANA